MTEGSGELGSGLLGLESTGGERLTEYARLGELEEEQEHELEPLLLPSKFSVAMTVSTRLEPDPVPLKLMLLKLMLLKLMLLKLMLFNALYHSLERSQFSLVHLILK